MKWFQLEIPSLTRADALAALPSSRIIFTPNPEILLELNRNPSFLSVLQKADLLLPDGHGLQLVSTVRLYSVFVRPLLLPFVFLGYLLRLLPCRSVYPEIIHGSDFMRDLLEHAHKRHLSVYFLGAGEGVAERTAHVALRDFPKLKVAGASAVDPGDTALNVLEAAHPDVVLVAYGAPKQEIFIVEAAQHLPFVQHFMGVGGSFDYYSGAIERAPRFMQNLGLEWLYRLYKEPRKRLRRIWNAVVIFPLKSVFSSDC